MYTLLPRGRGLYPLAVVIFSWTAFLESEDQCNQLTLPTTKYKYGEASV